MSGDLPTKPSNGVANTTEVGAIARRIDLYRSSMHAQYGWLFRRIYGNRFRKVEPDRPGIERIREVSKKGTVVYIMGRRAVLEYIFFNWYFLRFGLPLSRFANGINMLMWSPVRQALRTAVFKIWLRGRKGPLPDPIDSGFLRRRVLAGNSALLFLRREGGLFRRPQRSKKDMIGELIEAQRASDRTIYLAPQTIVWQRRPDRVRPRLLDLLFGSDENPGRLVRTLHFLLYSRGAVVRMGEPIDLKEFVDEHSDEPTKILARKLRWVLRGYLYRERQSVKGPQVKPQEWMFNLVRNDPDVRRKVEALAGDEPDGEKKAMEQVDRHLKQIAANLEFDWLYAVRGLFDIMLNRIYDGIEIDEEDLERIRHTMRRGPVLFLPCHRSHLDYILISWLLFQKFLMPPHIAAGINLSFWPAGPILRRCGAFFLKRSFQIDRLYGIVFKKYVHALIREGYPSEFFIEGGRSRTGRLLAPKVGILRMYVEAIVDRVAPDVRILPIGTGYERIVEERSYKAELEGGTKAREDLRGLARSARLLSSSYGRVHLKVGEPFSIRGWLDGLSPTWSTMDEGARHESVQTLGRDLIHCIGKAMVVTPSMVAATALLGSKTRGMEQSSYRARFEQLLKLAKICDMPGSASLKLGELAALEALERFERERAIDLVSDEDLGRYITINPERRINLDYYRNGYLLHCIVGAYVAAALCESAPEPLPLERIHSLTARWERLFQREFVVGRAPPLDEQVDLWIDRLESLGSVCRESRGIRSSDDGLVALLAANLAPTRESFRIVRDVLVRSSGQALGRDDWIKQFLTEGRRRSLTGDLQFPEALNKVMFANALEMLRNQDVLPAPSSKGQRTPDAQRIESFFAHAIEDDGALAELAPKAQT